MVKLLETPLNQRTLRLVEGVVVSTMDKRDQEAAVLVSSYYSKKPMKFWQMVFGWVGEPSKESVTKQTYSCKRCPPTEFRTTF